MSKTVLSFCAAVAAAAVAVFVRLARPVRSRSFRVRARYVLGRLRGWRHRWTAPPPDEDVPDAVLADRVRSSLGPLEHVLDVPRLNVMAYDHVVTLHGVVGGAEDEARLVDAAARVPGVWEVDSHVHSGITPCDTRPSQGHEARPPSSAMTRLLAAVERASGDGGAAARPTLHAALVTFVECLPKGEREQFLVHLPHDVRILAAGAGKRRNADDCESFAELVYRRGAVRADRAEPVARAVMAELRALVPEEVMDIDAVLPAALSEMWRYAVPV